MKSFSFNKNKKFKQLERDFPDDHKVKTIDGKKVIILKSLLHTAPQTLEQNGKFNKRKLNEFQFVIEKLKDETLKYNIMKKHLYNTINGQNFFEVLQKYSFNAELSDENGKFKLILNAAYYNHKRIIEWLIDEQPNCINNKNKNGENSLHLGKLHKDFNQIYRNVK